MGDDGWRNLARWLDDEPPSIDEAVIAAFDAVRNYKRVLIELRRDAANGEIDVKPSQFDETIKLCDLLITDLDGWGLNPKLESR